MSEITLTADPEVIEQAKRLAEQSGTTVSALFERLIRVLAKHEFGESEIGPLTRKATGVISLPEGKSYKDLIAEALAEKYGLNQ